MGTEVFLGDPPASIKRWIITHLGPTAPDGKVLYKTAADEEWLEDDADIRDNAFYGFANVDKTIVVKAIIPSKDASGNGVTSIGRGAFYDCSGLTNVTIPNSVMSIGYSAFYNCSGLTAVHITDLAAWCRISFGNSDANPLYYAHNLYLNGSLVTDLVIPDGVTSIGASAFSGCSGLTSVTIPDGVTYIGNEAFAYCSSLTSVEFEGNAPTVGANAFANVASGCKAIVSSTATGFPAAGETWNGLIVEVKS